MIICSKIQEFQWNCEYSNILELTFPYNNIMHTIEGFICWHKYPACGHVNDIMIAFVNTIMLL